MIVACLLILGAGNAAAADVPDDYLTDYLHTLPNYANVDFTEVTNCNNIMFQHYKNMAATVIANPKELSGSGFGLLGYYTSGGTTGTIISNVDAAWDENPDQNHNFDPNNVFGVFCNVNGVNFYADPLRNNPSGTKYVRIFTVTQNGAGASVGSRYVFCFDDGVASPYDYKDFIVEIHPLEASYVPEFPTVALPVAAVIGIMFIMGRKKE